ncbi:GNAT family N-acetyltransferase [Dulcicalothrix desertica]|uniref:GNAT family N-acetyltransferase n=1 Tax=Dulcicalothrix desertica TaxID=32056 RepID=UPI000F8F3F0C|nr:GNAT family N-acetyltransferase [Dulcicalothrix desertica]
MLHRYVGTVPLSRKKGFATALIKAALQESRAAGYRIATLQASFMGMNIYRQIGFKEYSQIGLYLWTGKES